MCLSAPEFDAGIISLQPRYPSLSPARQYNIVIVVRRSCAFFLHAHATGEIREIAGVARSQITLHFHINARRNWQPAIPVRGRRCYSPYSRPRWRSALPSPLRFALLIRRSSITKGAKVEAVNASFPVSEGDSSRFTPRPASRIAPISSIWLSTPLQPVLRTPGKTETRRLESRVLAARVIFSSRVKLSRHIFAKRLPP